MRKLGKIMGKMVIATFSVSMIFSQIVLAEEIGQVSENSAPESENIIIVDDEDALGEYSQVASDNCMSEEILLSESSSELSDPDVVEAINRAVGEVIYPGMTDLQKALALHDWLAIHCHYDKTYSGHTAKDALVEGSAVCEGYYLAYKLLLDAVGIENGSASGYSNGAAHVWNLIKIDGQWYHVDVTWDGQDYGKVSHSNFMKSDSAIQSNHSISYQDASCTSTIYDTNVFWNIKYSQETIRTGYFYDSAAGAYHLIAKNASRNVPGYVALVYRNDATGEMTELQKITINKADWWSYYADASQNEYVSNSANSSLILVGDVLYFNDAKHIYKVENNGTKMSTFYTAPDNRQIYGFMEQKGSLLIQLIDCIQNPNVGYETVSLPAYTWQWPEVVQGIQTVEGFVKRLYTICLGRSYDSNGYNLWYNCLVNHQKNASEVAYGFFFSVEFQNKNYSDEQFIELLYKTMFGRSSDSAGKSYWLSCLENGVSREYIYQGFAKSQEFSNLCDSFGVIRGSISLSQYRDQNVNATGFIARLYTKMLGRKYEDEGLEYWCKAYITKERTIEDIASDGFLHSQELANQNLSNEEFVTRMYETFLNREPEEAGLQDWISRLEKGEETRDSLVYGFTRSQEFSNLKAAYDLP